MNDITEFKRGFRAGRIAALKASKEDLETIIKSYQNMIEELEAFEPNPAVNEELIKSLQSMLENYPEYSTDWIRCINWNDYSNLEFIVMSESDENDLKMVSVKPEDLIPTYEKYGEKIEKHYEETCEFFDMEMVDVFMQYHFYGRVIYG